MRLPGSFDPLRERSFRLLFASRTVSVFGGTMAEVALAFAVLDIGTPKDLGLVILAREVPLVVFLLLGGVWADRLPRQLVLIGNDVVRGAAQGVSAALLLTGSASVLTLALLQIVVGSAAAFGRPAYAGIVPQVVSPERLQQGNALVGLSTSVVRIAGPAVGAAIVVASNPGWAIAIDAVTFAVSAVLLAGIRLPRTVRMGAQSVLGDLRDGWREFTARTWVVAMVASFGLFQLTVFPALLVLGPYVALHELGGPKAWGIILAVEAAGALVGGLLALHLRFRRPLVAGLLLMLPVPLELFLLGLAAPVPAIAIAGFVAGACLALGDVVWFTTLQQKIPEHAISRISSYDWLGSVVLNPLGYALIGPLSVAIGVGPALYAAAAINAASTMCILSLPSIRSLRAGPETDLAVEPT